jgi:heme-degrading monooxygenase HmoA
MEDSGGEDAAMPLRPDAVAANKKMLSDSSNTVGGSRSGDKGLILRTWKSRSTAEKSGVYVQHATRKVFPMLRAIAGHRGAYLLRRAVDGAFELVVLTIWESMESVRKFAGDEPEKAVVEPEARAVLTSFDNCVTHFEIIDRANETVK